MHQDGTATSVPLEENIIRDEPTMGLWFGRTHPGRNPREGDLEVRMTGSGAMTRG